jgi:sensor histidine kinase regulating citrate/malate metabolism
VWTTFAPAFQVGATTATQHTVEPALILTQVNQRDVQQDVFDDAVIARDTNFDTIHDVNTRTPQMLGAQLEDSGPLNNDLDDVSRQDSSTSFPQRVFARTWRKPLAN